MEQADHEQTARTVQAHPAEKGLAFNIAVTALEIGGSIAIFGLVRSRGGCDVAAYLAGTAAPVAGALVIWARSRSAGRPRRSSPSRCCRRSSPWWAAPTPRRCCTRTA